METKTKEKLDNKSKKQNSEAATAVPLVDPNVHCVQLVDKNTGCGILPVGGGKFQVTKA